MRWIWETGMGSACAPRQGGAIDAGRPLAIWRASFTRNSGIQPKQKQKPSSQRCGKSQCGAEPALPSAPRARMEKTRPSRTTWSRWVGQVTSKSSMGVRVVTHVTPWVGSTELDKNNDIKRRPRKRERRSETRDIHPHNEISPLLVGEFSCLCIQGRTRHGGSVGTRTVEGKGTRPKEREIKSAAPGLPAWSPTAVLPRLEPA